MTRILSPSLLVLLIASCTETPQPVGENDRSTSAVDPLDEAWALAGKLTGEWKNTLDSGDTLSYEHWDLPDSTLLTGTGFVLVAGDTVFIEDLKLARSLEAITYSARISTQNNGNWVPFTLTPAQGDTLRFVNPQHDFPNEIRYVRAAGDAWDVLVSGGGRSFPLHYVRR